MKGAGKVVSSSGMVKSAKLVGSSIRGLLSFPRALSATFARVGTLLNSHQISVGHARLALRAISEDPIVESFAAVRICS